MLLCLNSTQTSDEIRWHRNKTFGAQLSGFNLWLHLLHCNFNQSDSNKSVKTKNQTTCTHYLHKLISWCVLWSIWEDLLLSHNTGQVLCNPSFCGQPSTSLRWSCSVKIKLGHFCCHLNWPYTYMLFCNIMALIPGSMQVHFFLSTHRNLMMIRKSLDPQWLYLE